MCVCSLTIKLSWRMILQMMIIIVMFQSISQTKNNNLHYRWTAQNKEELFLIHFLNHFLIHPLSQTVTPNTTICKFVFLLYSCFCSSLILYRLMQTRTLYKTTFDWTFIFIMTIFVLFSYVFLSLTYSFLFFSMNKVQL